MLKLGRGSTTEREASLYACSLIWFEAGKDPDDGIRGCEGSNEQYYRKEIEKHLASEGRNSGEWRLRRN